jgi:hypothetical protein
MIYRIDGKENSGVEGGQKLRRLLQCMVEMVQVRKERRVMRSTIYSHRDNLVPSPISTTFTGNLCTLLSRSRQIYSNYFITLPPGAPAWYIGWLRPTDTRIVHIDRYRSIRPFDNCDHLVRRLPVFIMLVPIVRYYTIQGGKERIHEEGRRCYHRPDDPLLFNRHSSLNPCAHLRSLFDVELLLFTYAVLSTPGTTPGLTYRRTRSDHHNDANPPANCVIIVWTFGTRSNSSGHNLCTYPISCCHSVSFHQFPSITVPIFFFSPPP